MGKKNIEVLYRYCDDIEHIIVYQNGALLSDECEGFPKLLVKDIIECLTRYTEIKIDKNEEFLTLPAKDFLKYLDIHNIIKLEEEKIVDC